MSDPNDRSVGVGDTGTRAAGVSGGVMRILTVVLAVVALLVSGYLTLTATGETLPAGCGAGSGCAQVLSSKYARALGVPVSAAAVVVYLAVLISLLASRPRGVSAPLWPTVVLLGGAGAILGSAAWFVFVQRQILGAICPWCMAGHGVGALLAALVLVGTRRVPRLSTGAA